MKAWQYVQKGWTTGQAARDKYGKPCPPWSRHAVKWCAFGALEAAYIHNPRFFTAMWRLCAHLPRRNSIAQWNDKGTQATVVALLKQLKL